MHLCYIFYVPVPVLHYPSAVSILLMLLHKFLVTAITLAFFSPLLHLIIFRVTSIHPNQYHHTQPLRLCIVWWVPLLQTLHCFPLQPPYLYLLSHQQLHVVVYLLPHLPAVVGRDGLEYLFLVHQSNRLWCHPGMQKLYLFTVIYSYITPTNDLQSWVCQGTVNQQIPEYTGDIIHFNHVAAPLLWWHQVIPRTPSATLRLNVIASKEPAARSGDSDSDDKESKKGR